MRKWGFGLSVTLVLTALALLVSAEIYAYWLLWTQDNPDLGRICALDTSLLPYAYQVAIYEMGIGQWSSLAVLLPATSLITGVVGLCGLTITGD